MKRNDNPLPRNLPPRGLTQEQAAAYMGVSVSTFIARVRQGQFPAPIQDGRRLIFDRHRLDEWFDRLHANDQDVDLDDAVGGV